MGTPAPLQHNVVTTTSSGGTPNTASAAFSSNNAAGSLLVAAIGINTSSPSVSGITDSQGNTWSKAAATNGSSSDAEVWYAPNSKAGANTLTITITGTSSARPTTVDLVEVSNIVLASPLDKTALVSSSGTTPATGVTGVTTKAVEFLYGVIVRGGTLAPSAGPTDESASPATTYSPLDEVHSQNPSLTSAYAVSSATGAYAVGWTSANQNYIGIIATFIATRTISQAVTGSGAGSASIVKQAGKSLSATVSGAAAITHSMTKLVVLAASAAAAGNMTRSVGKLLVASSAGAATIARSISKTLIASSAALALMTRQIGKALNATAMGIASFVKTIGKILSAAMQGVANLVGIKITTVVVPPVVIEAPVIAVAQIVAPITGVCVIEAPVHAVAIIHARVR